MGGRRQRKPVPGSLVLVEVSCGAGLGLFLW